MSISHRFAPFGTLAAALLVSGVGAGCTDATPATTRTAQPAGDDHLKAEYDKAGRLQKLEYDRNNDGRPDTWGYMDGIRVVRVEVDCNGDGQVDRWEFHTTEGVPTPPPAPEDAVDPSLERIEESTRFDGKVSRKEFFTAGVLTRTEEDTDGNGAIDKWETYEGGALSVLALDTTGRGTPDRRLIYKAGTVDRIETDPAGTGATAPPKP